MKRIIFALGALAIIIVAIFAGWSKIKENKKNEQSKITSESNMKITSSVFFHNQTIPKKYTCDGEDINPPLQFLDVPKETKSLVLIVDDPDAPTKTWVHWVVYNVDPKVSSVDENLMPKSGVLGMTDFGEAKYGGPCPPSGIHRYFFKLYALDTMLSLQAGPTKEEVERVMKDHVLAKAELIGRYSKQ